jgi:sugar O-acyltransferase (sialic acid O-acetyltransferase NeuD family)
MNKKTQPIVVIGAGGHAKTLAGALLAAGEPPAGLLMLDDDEAKWGTTVLGVRVSGPISELAAMRGCRAVLGIGDNGVRKRLAALLQVEWISLVHPRAWVDPSVRLGPGTVIAAGAAIQPDTVIGAHTIVNTGTCVDHDCAVGDFVHLAPGVHLAGAVTVKEGAIIGTGASVIVGVTVGAWARVGAGAAVVRDLPDGVTAVGVPARPLRHE